MAELPFRMILASLFPENNDLFAARFPQDRRHDRRPADRGRANFRFVAADHQHFAERDLALVGVAEDVALDVEAFPLLDAVLLSTGTNDGEHWRPPKSG